jgi:DNA-binding response OmpR family regulator
MLNYRILVVDNDPQLRATLAAALEDAGFQVATAPNGLAALHAIARDEPALVLLDMQMPVLDGAGFAERLRAFGRSPGIIVMSGYPVSAPELRALGATAFIAKPFELDELIRRLTARVQPQAA